MKSNKEPFWLKQQKKELINSKTEEFKINGNTNSNSKREKNLKDTRKNGEAIIVFARYNQCSFKPSSGTDIFYFYIIHKYFNSSFDFVRGIINDVFRILVSS